MKGRTFVEVFELLEMFADLSRRALRAAKVGDFKRVEALLPEDLKTTIAKRLADDNAAQKFREENTERFGLAVPEVEE